MAGLLLLFLSPVLSQNTYSVCSSGCDFTTITTAFDDLSPVAGGDTVHVRSGTYNAESGVTVGIPVILEFEDVSVSCPSCTAAGSVWLTVMADVSMTGNLTIDGAGVEVNGLSTFTQTGAVTITSSTADVGVSVQGQSVWIQNGALDLSLNSKGSTSGVQLGANCVWTQNAPASITVANATSGVGVFLNSGSCRWEQNKLVTITASFAGNGVLLVAGNWTQSADAIISTTDATGVELQSASLWAQVAGQTTINVSSISVASNAITFVDSGSKWQQNSASFLNVNDKSVGVKFLADATWVQTDTMTINLIAGTSSTIGVDLTSGGIWQQAGDVTFTLKSGAQAIVCASSPVAGWMSSATVTGNSGSCNPSGSASTPTASRTPSLTPYTSPSPSSSPSATPTPMVSSSSTASPSVTPSSTASPSVSTTPTISPSPTRSPTASPSVSRTPSPTPSPSFVPSPSSSPVYLVSNTTAVVSVPVLQFNLTGPDIILLPKNSAGTVQSKAAVGVSLGQIKEVNDDGTIVRLGNAVGGGWKQVEDEELGSSSSYLFSSSLDMTDAAGAAIAGGGNSSGRVELQFYLFDSKTNISVGDLAFDALPSFAKFSIRLFDWEWASPADRIELRMKINPSFAEFTRQPNTPKAGITTFVLSGQHAAEQNTKTELRLIDSIELDGRQVSSGVLFDLNATTSELVLRFDYFNSTLEYDPDLGVLFGSPGKGDESSSGSDSLPLIIAVSVAVPVAIVIVLGAAVLITVIAHRNRKQRRRRLTKTMQMHQL